MTEDIKRFGGGKKEHPFRVGDSDEVYTAAAKIPAEIMVELVERNEHLITEASENGSKNGSGSKAARQFDVAVDMMEMVLYEESFEKFKQRLSDKKDPIDLRDLIDVMQWLLGEAYGLRPTQRSSSSGDTSEDDGQSSTAGVPDEALTQLSSAGAGPSILSTSGS